VRSSPEGWPDKAYRWFTRKPLSEAHLVFTDDPRFTLQEQDEWLEPPSRPLPGGVHVSSEMATERIRIRTDRPGHPLLVKVSYHPRWRAIGADGPYLVSPGLMMVVPHGTEVELVYGRTATDYAGLALTAGGLAVVAIHLVRKRRAAGAAEAPPQGPAFVDACDLPPATRRWGFVVPTSLVVLLFASRGLAYLPKPHPADGLLPRASEAYASKRYEAAAEYARHALEHSPRPEQKGELLSLRGESLLLLRQPQRAREAFETIVTELPDSPYRAQALSGAMRAAQAVGDVQGVASLREKLRHEFPDTPWAPD
jgi:hypothetical protein